MVTPHKSNFLPLLFSLALLISCPEDTPAQQFSKRDDFLRQERQQWYEYIAYADKFSGPSNFDVLFYHLDLDIQIDSPYLSGILICRFTVSENNVSSIRLNLHHALSVQQISGAAASFQVQEDTVTVLLERIYQSGENAEIEIEYQGVPELANQIKGLNYNRHAGDEPVIVSLSTPFLAHYWWPCKDGPGDKADSVYIDITIPDTTIRGIPVIAVSNGILENVVTSAGKKTFQWRHRYPIVPYYVMVAISNYRYFQHEYTPASGNSFPLIYYVFDDHLTDAQTGVSELPAVLDLFSDLFGAYPFEKEKYGMTQTGFYGAIENQTNTIIRHMSSSLFRVTVHELAHMWFGNMITCSDWHHGWLNEGFATYCEALWAERRGGSSAYAEYMTYLEYYGDGTLYLQTTDDPFNIFIEIIYYKGAYFLHMLRGVTGDSLFFECMRRYAQNNRFRYGHATTEDFRAICEEVTNTDLDYFFDQWIYDEYYPCYEYTYAQDPFNYEVSVWVNQIQKNRGWRHVFEMPLQLKFTFFDGSETLITVWNDSTSQQYKFGFSRQVTNMDFDPENRILKEAKYNQGPVTSVPTNPVLYQNFPNPFNSTTTIIFDLPHQAGVILRIFDIRGKEIRTLFSRGNLNAGSYYLSWDGTNNFGVSVTSGVYVYQLVTGETSQANKLIFLK